MAVGIPDGPTPQGILDHFQQATTIPENENMVLFMVKKRSRSYCRFLSKTHNVTLDKKMRVMHFIWYKKWISGSTNMCYQSRRLCITT